MNMQLIFVANFVSCHEVSCVHLICKSVIIPTDKTYAQWQYGIRIQRISMWQKKKLKRYT